MIANERLFQLVSIAKVSSPRRYWYRDIWYRDISWYRQYRPTLAYGKRTAQH